MPQRYIDFAYVKENATFEPVIARYNLKLIGTGASRRVLCPFHKERNPSCSIDLERKIFHCFGCGAKGNILEFVAKLDNSDLRAAAIKIADICGIATAAPRERAAKPDQQPRQGAKRARIAKEWAQPAAGSGSEPAARARVEEIHGPAAELVNPPLTFALKLDPAHPYLAERRLSAEVVEAFGLGYCRRGVMAGRICIPIHNERGELVAYAGGWPAVTVPDDQERYRLPAKFEKSRVLFNLHRVSDAEHVVLVEGYWSAVRLHALGVPVLALMGWSVSPDQITLLRERGTRFVTLLLDGDEAGRRAREKALPELASQFFVRAPELPEGEKPDTLEETQLLALVRFPTP